MNKESLIHEARDFFNEAKKQIKKIGLIESASILFCKGKGSMNELIVPGWNVMEESKNENKKQAHFELIMKLAEDFNAVAVIHIGDAWIREKIADDNKASNVVNPSPSSREPNRMEALVMVISMPGFSSGIMQPYSRIGDTTVFGEEIAFELGGTTEAEDYKCFVDFWGFDENANGVDTSTTMH